MASFCLVVDKNNSNTGSGRELTQNLANNLSLQDASLQLEYAEGDRVSAVKFWAEHSRCHGIARDSQSGSFLMCIGNPSHPKYSEISSDLVCSRILNDYLYDGVSAIEALSAPFVAVIYDGRSHHIRVLTDRVGLQQVYFHQDKDRICVSSSSVSLAAAINASLDPEAISLYFSTGYLVGLDTFYSDITKIAGATELTIKQGIMHERTYWQPPYEETSHESIQACGERLAQTYKKVVNDQLEHEQDLTIELTGGLDSRFNLTAAVAGEASFRGWTIGEDNCSEAEVVKQLQRSRHFDWNIVSPCEELQEQFLADLEQITHLTDGETNSLMLISSPSCNRQTDAFRKASVSGSGGELFRGFYYPCHLGLKQASVDRIVNYKFQLSSGYSEGLFSEYFPANTMEILTNRLQQKLDTYVGSMRWKLDRLYFDLRESRFAGRSCSFNNYFYRQLVPFFNNEIIDFAFSTPCQYKDKSRIVRHALNSLIPAFGNIPLLGGLPARPLGLRDMPSVCYSHMKYSGRVVRKLTNMKMNKPVINSDQVGIQDIIKQQMRQHVPTLLDYDNMASAFLYNPDVFRKYIKQNLSNGFLTNNQVGLMMTFEMLCRILNRQTSPSANARDFRQVCTV